MKICLIGNSLAAGAAERVMATMANYWAAEGWDVTVITIATYEPFYSVDPRVRLVPLGLYAAPPVEGGGQPEIEATAAAAAKRMLLTVADPFLHFRQAMRLRRAIKDCAPSAVVSFVDQANVLTLIATRGLGVPVFVSEQIHPSYHRIDRLWQCLRRLLYPFATNVVIQCEQVREAFPYLAARKAVVIPSPIVAPRHAALAETPGTTRLDRPKILGMGRLVPQKGFDLLIRAFASLPSELGRWSLEIWGRGTHAFRTGSSRLGAWRRAAGALLRSNV